MKNAIKLFGIIAIVAVIGFSFAACGDGGDDTKDEGRKEPTGIFMLTDIPSEYNGKYAYLYSSGGETYDQTGAVYGDDGGFSYNQLGGPKQTYVKYGAPL